MVRNPKRIKVVLAELEKLWMKYPDMRLGQLMWLAAGRDPFHMEDYDMLDSLAERTGVTLEEERPEYFIEPNAWDDIPEIIRKIQRGEKGGVHASKQ